MKKNVSLKNYIITILITAILTLSVASYVYSQGSEIAIVEDSFVKCATYVIENDGTTIKAFNGTTGELAYSGTNAATVIQSAINVLTAGGKIFIKQGTYELDAPLTSVANGLIIEGVGHGISGLLAPTKLKLGNNVNLDVINMIHSNIIIRDLYIDGNKANNIAKGGIRLGGNDNSIENVGVLYAPGSAIILTGNYNYLKNAFTEYCDSYGFYLTNDNNVFDSCVSYDNKYAVYLDGADKNIFSNCMFEYNDQHSVFIDGAQQNIFDSCIIIGNGLATNNTYDAIRLSTKGATHSEYNIFGNLIIDSTAANVFRYGIYEEDSNQDYNIFHDSIVTDSGTVNINTQGANTYVHHSWNGTTWIS